MVKRMVLMLAAVSAFIAAIGFVKYRQIQSAIAQAANFQPPPEAVTTLVASEEEWEENLTAIGSVAAVQGVEISADLPGIVEKISFDSGKAVREGEVLVVLDTRQEQAQLAAAEARRELARLNLERIRGLRAKGVTSQAEHDAAIANSQEGDASVEEIRASIARKTIRAPFSGILGIRLVNLGQYLRSGDPVVSLQSFDPIHVNFGLPQQELGLVKVGGTVRVSMEGSPSAGRVPAAVRSEPASGGPPPSEERGGTEKREALGVGPQRIDAEDPFSGTITAIDSIVDEATRNVQVQATLRNADRKLRAGMFVEVEYVLDSRRTVVTLPASAIRHAPYGESVFIVENLTGPNGSVYRGVRQQFVKLGGSRGDQVAIESGVAPGEEVVTSGVFKLRNGSAVSVSNDVLPGNDPAPRPEES
jgi:membrane fusion protein (multidrug efflux system)